MEDTRKEIESAIAAYFKVWKENNPEHLMEFYTDDCRLFPPGQNTVIGKPAVQEAFKGIFSAFPNMTCPQVDEVIQNADNSAWSNSVLEALGPEGQVHARFKDGLLWKKLNGKWLLHRDFFNALPAQE